MAFYWEPLIRDHHESLLRFLTRVLRSEADAADVAQDTYIRLHTSCTPALHNPKAYLFTTAHNLAINHLHRENRLTSRSQETTTEELYLRNSFAEPVPEPSQCMERDQLLERIGVALGELPGKCGAAFWMHRFQHLSYAQISTRLGVSRSMIEKYVMRATAHCRAYAASQIECYRFGQSDGAWSLLIDGLAVTSRQLALYRREGLCMLPRPLPVARLRALRTASTSCWEDPSVAWHNSSVQGGPPKMRTTYFVWRQHFAFRDLVFDSALPQLAAELLDASGARLFFDQLCIKQPGDHSPGAWRRDVEPLPICNTRMVTMLLALDPAVLRWIPGSHTAWQSAAPRLGHGHICAIASDETCARDVHLEPGNCVVFDGRLLHRFAQLKVDRFARLLALRFIDPGAQWRDIRSSAFEYLQDLLPGVRLREGSPVSGPLFPLVLRSSTKRTLSPRRRTALAFGLSSSPFYRAAGGAKLADRSAVGSGIGSDANSVTTSEVCS